MVPSSWWLSGGGEERRGRYRGQVNDSVCEGAGGSLVDGRRKVVDGGSEERKGDQEGGRGGL